VRPRIILFEDHLAYRESFRIALRYSSQFDVVGEAASGREACKLAERSGGDVDLAVVDFLLADTDAVSLARELRRRRVRMHMLVLASLAHPLFVANALAAGFTGYALKSQPLSEILDAMQTVLDGGDYLSPQLSSISSNFEQGKLGTLTHREREVLFQLLGGLSSKEIARALFVSTKTVEAHRLHINRKLDVRTPAELARFAADHGLIARRSPASND
jgi:DNA-binding NarL/FixJ family response regulator